MTRGRPRLSDAEKARRQQEKQDRQAQNAAAAALERFPADKEKRLELFQERDALVVKQHSVSGEMSAHQKRMREVFGHHPVAMKIRDLILKARPGEREAIVVQAKRMLDDAGCEVQFDLFGQQPGVEAVKDEGSVFDQGSVGSRQAGEQPDPARARRSRSRAPAPEPAPTPGIPLDQAQAAFEAANAAVEERKAGRRSRKGKAGASEDKPISEQMREGSAGGDEHLRKERTKRQAKSNSKINGAAPHDDEPEPPPAATSGIGFDDSLDEDEPAAPVMAGDPFAGATGQGDYRIAS